MKFRYATTVALSALCISNAAFAQSAGDEIVVTGQRAQQQKAIAAKRDALGLIDVASSDEIGQLPDKNVAEVIERLPGVGVQYDQGEGRYVAVRGVPSALNGYTLNGFEIGNPDGNTRQLPLDIVSGQLLNRVEVVKVKTADLIGQGIGGTINLVQQTAFDFTDPFVVAATAQIGYQELRDDDYPVKGDISVGGRFGADEEFGILLGASYSNRTYTSYGMYPDDWFVVPAAARGGMPTNIKYTDYRLKRERLAFAGSLDWHGATTELYLRGIYSKFTEDEYRQRFRLDFASADDVADGSVLFNADGITGTSTATGQRSDLRLEYKEKSILSVMAGGKTELDGWTFDYGVARTHNEVIEPNQVWQFRGNPGTVAFDFTNKLYTAAPVAGPLTPADMEFRSYAEQDETGDEDIWQGRIDIRRDLAMGEDSFFKFGANVRATDKSFDSNNTGYGRGDAANRFSMVGLSGPNVSVYPAKGRPYLIAPTIDENLIREFTIANLNSPLFVLDTSGTLEDAVLGDFSLNEDVYAGYAMVNLDFGQVAITGGLRVEKTDLDVTGFQLENGTDVVAASQSSSYTDWLPSLTVRIKPADDVIVRLAYSRSIGRPNYSDLSPGGGVSYVDLGTGQFDGSVSLGNPNLKPYVADALDASAEWYFAPGGLLSVGVFAKWIDNPIFTRSFTLTDTTFGARDYATLEYSQPENADSGDIVGLEAAYQQQFTFLPGLLSGFGVNLNLTLIESSLRVPGRSNSDFAEQSDMLWGAQLFYQKGSVEGSIGYHHTGKALIGVANNPLDDQYNDDLRRLDAKIAFDVTPNIRIFAEGQNLTDEPTRQYQGGIRNWVIQNERYGRTYYAGVSLKW